MSTEQGPLRLWKVQNDVKAQKSISSRTIYEHMFNDLSELKAFPKSLALSRILDKTLMLVFEDKAANKIEYTEQQFIKLILKFVQAKAEFDLLNKELKLDNWVEFFKKYDLLLQQFGKYGQYSSDDKTAVKEEPPKQDIKRGPSTCTI